MNLCNQGHEDIAYEGSSDCPLCAANHRICELTEFIETRIGPVKYDEETGHTSFPPDVG